MTRLKKEWAILRGAERIAMVALIAACLLVILSLIHAGAAVDTEQQNRVEHDRILDRLNACSERLSRQEAITFIVPNNTDRLIKAETLLAGTKERVDNLESRLFMIILQGAGSFLASAAAAVFSWRGISKNRRNGNGNGNGNENQNGGA